MKKMNNREVKTKICEIMVKNDETRRRLLQAMENREEYIMDMFGTGAGGLTEREVERNRERFGENVITKKKRKNVFNRIALIFADPFTVILLILAAVSVITDIILAPAGERNYATSIIIIALVSLSGVLRLIQESRSENAAERMAAMVNTTACVERCGIRAELPIEEIVVGDLVYLSAGDMIPGDLRILEAKDLFISQSALTGESEPEEKTGKEQITSGDILNAANLAFMGSNVISGTGRAVVIAVGDDTVLGGVARELSEKPPKSAFEKGVSSVSWLLMRLMLVMVPVVLFVNGFTKGDWLQAALFAVSVAVGLTPEMLPMIVTSSLAKGSVALSGKNVIVKELNAVQNLGSMDVLCTDKTGTLTQDKVVLEYHLNIEGEEDARVLRHAFLNSYFQTGLKNLIDIAVIEKQRQMGYGGLIEKYTKVDEIPFDFERRRMSVVVKDVDGKTQMVTKGAVEEMLGCCSFVELAGQVMPLTLEARDTVMDRANQLNDIGMRVIAVAQKTDPSPVGQFSIADESDMVLIGFLAFLDPPKDTARGAIQALRDHGVEVKVLTGDNDKVARAICAQVGIAADKVLLGSDLDDLNDAKLGELAENTQVFAKLAPSQKARVIRVLRERGHNVGYMGDGINDAAAMRESDVGISVDTAVDVAKETASVVMTEKDLMVLEQGVLEGRRTYANMMKYIKMTVSSNFGNMLSVLAASVFLPFLPMAAIHIMLLNMVYDISCMSISWDNVDADYLKKPRKLETSSISRFMLTMGPISSLLDIATYLLMYFCICPRVSGGAVYSAIRDPAVKQLYVSMFQTGWFVESMWTQALVIHTFRTEKMPFVHSRASWQVSAMTLLGCAAVTLIPYTPLGAAIGMACLPSVYFAGLAALVVAYMALASLAKRRYIRRYGELL